MLFRKMLREIRMNPGQFISIFLLATIAMMLFSTFQSSTIGSARALKQMRSDCALADVWMYGEDFREDDLAAVRALDDVNDAQLRMSITAKSADQGNAQVDVYFEEENKVSMPEVLKGEDFDPSDTEGLWLSKTFADAWDLRPGDSFAYVYNGVTVEKTIRGLIASPEYIYQCADEDLDTDLSNIAYVYMSYRGFPVREYLQNQIRNGKITAADLKDKLSSFDSYGISADDITQDMMLQILARFSDEKLFSMLPYTQLIFTTDADDVFSIEKEVSDAIDGNYAVYIDRSSIPGIRKFDDEMNQHRQFSYGFSLIFVLIALLVIVTSTKRMVEQQRTQIGTLNAMGVKRWKIALHYISYSFAVSVLGSAVGLIIGVKLLGHWFVQLFRQWYMLPGWNAVYSPVFIVMAAATVVICCLTAWLSCRRLLRVHPSEALRPAPPKAGKRCIFERLPFWHRLRFHAQYDLRDISRSKLRTFMAIFGTACGMMLTVCALGCNDTLANVEEWSFEKLQDYKYEALLSETVSEQKADSLAEKYDGELVMSDSIEIAAKNHALHDDRKTGSITAIEGKGLYNVTDTDLQVVSLKPGTVALSMKMARALGISKGDTVWWHIYDENEWHESEVSLINRAPTVSGITILRDDFEGLGEKYEPAMLVSDNAVSKDDSVFTAVHDRSDVLKAFEQSMQIMYTLVYLLLAFSALLVIIVLYNSGNLSFNERVREFATLKVLGYRSERIRRLLSLQNVWLTAVGVIIGAPFGKVLLQYMMDSNGDSYDYVAVISAKYYIIAAAFVLVVSLAVSFMFSRRIKHLDMVGALKGAE